MNTLLAGLIISTALGAPALPPRNDWVGQQVFVKGMNTPCGTLEADGKLTPTETLNSIQFTVIKEQKGFLQVARAGKLVWVEKEKMVLLKDAPAYYTKMIDEDPEDSHWRAYRGWAYSKLGKLDEALKDYSEAIRIHGGQPNAWHNNRGLIYADAKKYDEAIKDFTIAIEGRPGDTLSLRNRANTYNKMKKYEEAIKDFENLLKLDDKSAVNYNAVAWILCTCTDAKVRNGKRSIELATKACELTEWKNGGYLDTLAAAYAEAGQFDKAVEWQEKALKTTDFPLIDLEEAKKRLELFKTKKPYHKDE